MKIQYTTPIEVQHKPAKRRLAIKVEKVSLKTGLRAGIHDSDRYT